MKEKLYTIPVNDAFEAGDECPFCYLERKNEQEMLDFILGSGSSYMERDIREQTDKKGFCREHFGKMFQYGNSLGNAWILKTHYKKMLEEMKQEVSKPVLHKKRTTGLIRKKYDRSDEFTEWILKKKNDCYFCEQQANLQRRYLETFFMMFQKDLELKEKIETSNGFCLHHTQELLITGFELLPVAKQDEFQQMMVKLGQENLERLAEEISWLVDKFDYRNQDADWKNSKDALQRGMQKLWGGYPAEPAYRQKK